MSLQAFQQAIVELTLAPRRVRRLLEGDLSVLENYDLTERERKRILFAVGQPGMELNCTIARGNRFEPVAELFPMTCTLLKPVLRELLDEIWEDAPPTNYQFAGEDEAFIKAVSRKLATGELAIEYLDEVFSYESRCVELARRMGGETGPNDESEAIIEFQHPGIEAALKDIAAQHQFRAEAHTLIVRGICASCSAARANRRRMIRS